MLGCYFIMTALSYDVMVVQNDTIMMMCHYLTFGWNYFMMSLLYNIILHMMIWHHYIYDMIMLHYVVIISWNCYLTFMTSLHYVLTLHYDIIMLRCLYMAFWCHYIKMLTLYDVQVQHDIITLHYVIIYAMTSKCCIMLSLYYVIISLHYASIITSFQDVIHYVNRILLY